MKTLMFAIIFLATLINVRGQSLSDETKKNNEIDIVISDVLDGAFQLKYERAIGNHFAVSLGLGYKGDKGFLRRTGLNTDKVRTDRITFSGYKIIPEVRYYIGRQEYPRMKGFYLGAYLKYSNYHSDLQGSYFDDALKVYDIQFDADITVTSLGLMVGYKLPVYKDFSIDFLIAGPGSGFYDFSFENKKDLPDEFYEDLNEALEQYPIFNFLDGDFRFSALHRKSNFNLFSLRYAISIGYSF